MTQRITPCLWFDGDAEAAATFYAATFPDSSVDRVTRAAADYPAGQAGDVLTVEFTVLGMPMLGLNGGGDFPFTEAVSFQVHTDDQAETDRYWAAIVDGGGSEVQCGWCRDRWGLSWQIIPRRLTALMADPDPARARRAMEAMMAMVKIDIATLDAAADEAVLGPLVDGAHA